MSQISESINIIVKLRRISQGHIKAIRVTDQFKKHKLDFPYNDVNYNTFNALLNNREYAYFHASKEGKNLTIIGEAAFQAW